MEIRINVDRIKERGFPLEREFTGTELEELLRVDPPSGYRPTGPATLRSQLSRVREKDILFEGDVEMELATECRRCLAAAAITLPVQIFLHLVEGEREESAFVSAVDEGDGEVAGSFLPEEADRIYYTGKEVDLAPMIREQILLAMPLAAVCGAECKGLCQICGQNLNEGSCGCDRHIPDPRWAGLKNIKV